MKALDNPQQEYQSIDTTVEAEPMVTGNASENHQRLFRRGMRWLGAGVFLMAASFGINFLLFDSDTSFVTIMYVLTSLGVLCIMKCLADILGF